MGKDSDLLEAARSGNVPIIDKLLSHRFRRSAPLALAPLASLRRTANPNCQDQSGETPLHHAALNGHRDAVCALLRYEASANIMDNKGCFPLHLAAFNGHSEICMLLLTQGPSIAKVNEQNHEGDSALHFAAQFGHSEVVNILLQHTADATIRNLKNESALDLASQYGRLETVQLVLRKNPSLLNSFSRESCPLHLAARHGHLHVVQLLLDSGMDINLKTDKGSALQEAAFFGRYDVVLHLLQRGIDTQLTDIGNKTVLDQLTELDSQRSLDIGRVILQHIEGKDVSSHLHLLRQKRDSDLIRLGSSVEKASLETDSHSSTLYSKVQRLSGDKASLKSIGSRESIISSNSQSAASLLDEPIYDTPAHLSRPLSIPKGSKRRSEGSDLSESPNGSPQNCHASSSPKTNYLKSADTPKKPPRRKLHNNLSKILQSDVEAALQLHHNGEGDSKVKEMARRASLGSIESNKNDAENNNNKVERHIRPPSLNLAERPKSATPLSPTGYDQPPTPDHPPPSPSTAEIGIVERIHSNDKRMSRDMETNTEKQYFDSKTASTPQTQRAHNNHNGSSPGTKVTQRRTQSQIEAPTPPPRNPKRISAPVVSHYEPIMSKNSPVKVTQGQSKVSKGDKKSSDAPLDENEEWAKIADIMASVGGGFDLESVLVREWEDAFASTFGQGSKGTVVEWLQSIGLAQYENAFMANGFDDLTFMSPVDDQDLLEIGILDATHRDLILESAKKLPHLKTIDEAAPDSVEKWLQSLNLSSYWQKFQSHNFTDLNRVQQLWDLELNNVLDIRLLGHRKRMLASLRQSSSEGDSSGEEFKDFTRTLNWNCVGNKDGKSFDQLNLFKDYSNLKPLPRTDNAVPANVDLRPPQASTETNIQQWRHQPEALIRGSCRYSAQYLGSTVVKDLQGTESTKEAIVKMKKSTENVSRVPTIVLSISYTGVKFIDVKDQESEHVICEHEINNIFCACQDGENLSYFAYITKDHASHFCHVFSVKNTELATEIILTLGEAFEVAYQVSMQSSTDKSPAKEE